MEDALQYRLQYEAPDKLPGPYRSLTFYLQICTFLSGADGIRTHALRRAKARKYVLARFGASGDYPWLQPFCGIAVSGLSAAYQLVPSRLQYSCSTVAVRPRAGWTPMLADAFASASPSLYIESTERSEIIFRALLDDGGTRHVRFERLLP